MDGGKPDSKSPADAGKVSRKSGGKAPTPQAVSTKSPSVGGGRPGSGSPAYVGTTSPTSIPPALFSVGNNKYSLGRKLGSGSFGEIYLAVSTETGEELAAKVEKRHANPQLLMYEAKLLKHFQGAPGIANVYFSGVVGDFNVMVMDLLGRSLEEHFKVCDRSFSLKTVIMLTEQMLERVEYLHSKNYIHRDIKPDNFLIGNGKNANTIYLIDYGLAKKYRDPKTNEHVPYRENKKLTGTMRYASINAHLGIEQSRRSDLEALGYVWMYFNRGNLPWMGITAPNKEDKYRMIRDSKMQTTVEVLCDGYPEAFATFMSYSRSLRFDDKPDYQFLRRLFHDLYIREGFPNDGTFEWCLMGSSTGASVVPMDRPESALIVGQDVVGRGSGEKGARRVGRGDASLGGSGKSVSFGSDGPEYTSPATPIAEVDPPKCLASAGAASAPAPAPVAKAKARSSGFFASLLGCGTKSAVKDS